MNKKRRGGEADWHLPTCGVPGWFFNPALPELFPETSYRILMPEPPPKTLSRNCVLQTPSPEQGGFRNVSAFRRWGAGGWEAGGKEPRRAAEAERRGGPAAACQACQGSGRSPRIATVALNTYPLAGTQERTIFIL